jgi:hypothetical protein
MKICFILLFLLCSCSSTRNKSEFIRGYVYGYKDGCLFDAKTKSEQDACEDRFNLHRSKYGVE